MRKKKWDYTDVGCAHQAELIVRNVWLVSGRLAVCLSGERRHNAGLEMVIAPTPRTAGVETLECFEAGNVMCHSLGWIRIHHLCWASGSHICNVNLNAFIWYSYRLSFSNSSTQIHFTVAIDFTASNGNFFRDDCFLFWVCFPCCWQTYLNEIWP